MTNRKDCNESEWTTRTELAALYRLAAHFGWTDLTSTHISARLLDDADRYLLNSHDLMFDEMTASNITTMRYTGESESNRVVNMAGHIIHSGILSARPEVNFVIHSHTRAGVAVSAMPGGLQPLSQHAGFVHGTLSTHPFQDSTAVEDEGAALARDLGSRYAMLLQNHGLLVVGRTAAEAFTYHYYLEMACKIQVDILSSVAQPIRIADEAMKPLDEWGDPANGPHGHTQWPSLLRLLDRKYPDYRT